MSGAALVRADALRLPLTDNSVDLICTSSPYWGQRGYVDDGERYEAQIGAEDSPAVFLVALWRVMDECWRVLKPSGSCWFNLGDKYGGSGSPGTSGVIGSKQPKRSGLKSYVQSDDVPAKSLLGLPWRFAMGLCCPDPYRQFYDPGDHVSWVLRAEVPWNKTNLMPDNAQDRVRRSHENWFHLTKQGDYFSAVDELREPVAGGRLGNAPGSVWTIPTEPLMTPEFFIEDAAGSRAFGDPCTGEQSRVKLRRALWEHCERAFERGEPVNVSEVEHYAAFPIEWPRRIIEGWSPNGICIGCGAGRKPVVEREIGDPGYTREFRKRTVVTGGEPSGGGCHVHDRRLPVRM